MRRHNMIMQFLMSALVLAFFIVSSAYADENGKISSLTYSPQEIVALEDVTISIGVNNPSGIDHNYVLQMQFVKDGNLITQQEFAFTLAAGKSITLNPTYNVQSIGEYQIIAKLFDNYKIAILDTRFIKFNSVSHIGPFDIVVDPLTSRIRPGYLLPVKVSLDNQGTRSTDVEVRLAINCPDRIVTQSFTTYVGSSNHTEKILSMDTCQQEGLYEVVGSILLFNKTLISSSSQFFVNSSYIQLKYQVPENITLKPGDSYSFPVEVTNLGNEKVTELQFLIQQIPYEWQHTTPASIAELQPGKTAVFIINLTIPKDAEPRTYETRMNAVAEETIAKQISTLQVIPLGTPPNTSILPFAISSEYVMNFLEISAGVIVGGVLVRIYVKRKFETPILKPDRMAILNKIKTAITPPPNET